VIFIQGQSYLLFIVIIILLIIFLISCLITGKRLAENIAILLFTQ